MARSVKVLEGQPFDEELLQASALYRRSRELYLKQGGTYEAALLSSPRSLGSLTLIRNHIEYTPLARELAWSLKDPIERKTRKHFELVRTFVTSVFHEQSHRILWKILQDRGLHCPTDPAGARRFLNLAESLVIALDMALGDSLGAAMGMRLYEQGVIYNPGTGGFARLARRRRARRIYRNALQASFHATYLCLQGMHPEDIPNAVRVQFPMLSDRVREASVRRALTLDPLFVELTNPVWQKKHTRAVVRAFGPAKGSRPLALPARTAVQSPEAYLLGETWFATMGL